MKSIFKILVLTQTISTTIIVGVKIINHCLTRITFCSFCKTNVAPSQVGPHLKRENKINNSKLTYINIIFFTIGFGKFDVAPIQVDFGKVVPHQKQNPKNKKREIKTNKQTNKHQV
jgi:hypothetical protein